MAKSFCFGPERMCISVFGRAGCGYTTQALEALVKAEWPFKYHAYDSKSKLDFFEPLRSYLGKKTKDEQDKALLDLTYPQIILFSGGPRGTAFEPKLLNGASGLQQHLKACPNVKNMKDVIENTCYNSPFGSAGKSILGTQETIVSDALDVIEKQNASENFFYKPGPRIITSDFKHQFLGENMDLEELTESLLST